MGFFDLFKPNRDKSEDVRRAVGGDLTEIGKPAVEPLIVALKDRNGDVRKKAAETLDKIGWQPKDATPQEIDVSLIEAIEPLMAAPKDAEALDEIGNTRAVEPLIAALKDVTLTPREIEEAVEPLIKDEGLLVRIRAAWALGQIGDTRAIVPLEELAQNDLSSFVTKVAKAALAKLRGK